MSDVTQEKIVAFLSNLTLGEAAQLVAVLEDTLGVRGQATPPVISAAYGVPDVEDVLVDVFLDGFRRQKIDVIKVVRQLLGLGLREAKALVDGVPSRLYTQVDIAEAEELREVIEGVGGVVTFR